MTVLKTKLAFVTSAKILVQELAGKTLYVTSITTSLCVLALQEWQAMLLSFVLQSLVGFSLQFYANQSPRARSIALITFSASSNRSMQPVALWSEQQVSTK